MIRAKENLVGAWAFLICVVLAIIVGIVTGIFTSVSVTPLDLGILSILGLFVGFFVAEKDISTFLIASISLVVVSYIGISGLILGAAISGLNIGNIISSVLQSLLALFVPATIVVALKSVFSIAKS